LILSRKSPLAEAVETLAGGPIVAHSPPAPGLALVRGHRL